MQQTHWHPPHSVWCPAMIDVLFVGAKVILATTVLILSVMAVMNLAILHRAPKFLHQEHSAIETDLILGINTPITKGADISTDHSPTTIPTITEATTFLSHTAHSSSSNCSSSCNPWPKDVPVTSYAVISTGIVTPHPTLVTSSQMTLMPLHGPEQVLLQQLPLHSTRISAQKSQTVPEILNPP